MRPTSRTRRPSSSWQACSSGPAFPARLEAATHLLDAVLVRVLRNRGGLDMWLAFEHVQRMSKMIQIRNVPDDVHKALKIRATREGMSLSDFLRREVTKVASTLTVQEALERARRRGPVELDEDPAETIRELRGPLP